MKRLPLPLALVGVGLTTVLAAGLITVLTLPTVISGTPRPAPSTWSFVIPTPTYGSCTDCGR